MKYEKPKLRFEEWEEEDVFTDVVGASLSNGGDNNEDTDEDPWTGGEGGNVPDTWW